MDIKKIRDDLFNQEVDRKQFLQIVGVSILGLIGVTTFLQNLIKFSQPKGASQRQESLNYGETFYGQ